MIPFIFWSLIGLVYNFCVDNQYFVGKSITDVIAMIANTQVISIYWFFIPLFSVYLSIPILSLIPSNLRVGVFKYSAIISFVLYGIIPCFARVLDIPYNNGLQISAVSGYMCYILIGYLISHCDIKKRNRIVLYILGVVGFLFHLLGTY